ncbi:MAG TPA: mechanosensitive ion channel family protein [Gemmatimonadales bacterium]|nr:mechanosensitive ion channel family protein [Gemmatimonadales bacterium]
MLRTIYSVLLALAALANGLPAAAQTPDTNEDAETTAPVVLDGYTLFQVRGARSYPAERRAGEIADRIARVASDRGIPVDSLIIRETPVASLVLAEDRLLLGVLDADAELEGINRQVVAEGFRRRIGEGIREYRREREPGVLWVGAERALAATLALAVALWLGRLARRRMHAVLERRYRQRVHDFQVSNIPLVRAEQLWRLGNRLLTLVAVLVAATIVYFYLEYVLVLFPWTRALGFGLTAMLLRPVTTLVQGALDYVPNIIFLLVLAIVTRWLLAFIHVIFRQLGDGSLAISGFDQEWAVPTERIVRLLVFGFALVVAYPYIPGSGTEAFKGLSIMFGILFSIGSSSVIGNLVAGQSLAFRRAFRVGDRIRVGEHVGEVTKTSLLTTFLRSAKNEQIVIPNSVVLNAEVINYSTLAAAGGVIVHTTVGIGYETPWRQVEAMLLEAAARTPGLLREPQPFVLQRGLGDFAITYEINAYTDDALAMLRLASALHRNILDIFNEYGVQIMTPAYEGDPDVPKVVPREQWFTAPARTADLPMGAMTQGNGGPG